MAEGKTSEPESLQRIPSRLLLCQGRIFPSCSFFCCSFLIVLNSSCSNLPPSIWSLIFSACPLVLTSCCLLKPDRFSSSNLSWWVSASGSWTPVSLTFMCYISTLCFVEGVPGKRAYRVECDVCGKMSLMVGVRGFLWALGSIDLSETRWSWHWCLPRSLQSVI